MRDGALRASMVTSRNSKKKPTPAEPKPQPRGKGGAESPGSGVVDNFFAFFGG